MYLQEYVCATTLLIMFEAQRSVVLHSRAINHVFRCMMAKEAESHNSMWMKCTKTHKCLNLYHAWSRGSATNNWGTFHHFKYETSLGLWHPKLNTMHCMQRGDAIQCNISMSNAIWLKHTHKAKVTSMPNAMQPIHANVQCNKHATTMPTTSMRQHAI